MSSFIPINVSVTNDEVIVSTYLFMNDSAALTNACFLRSGPNLDENNFFICRSAMSDLKSPTNSFGVYPLSMYRSNRQL